MAALPTYLLNLLEEQYRHEMSNHLRYLARASWARFRGWEGAGDFFSKEAEGEAGHAKLVRDFIELRNETLVPAPFNFDEKLDVSYFDELFTTAMEVELQTTVKLVKIFTEAMDAGDIQTVAFVQPMISEQSEEENLYQTIIDRIIQRGGGGSPQSAIGKFREDLAAAHDIDVWIAERQE